MSVDTWQEAVALMPTPPTVAEVDEALSYATAGNVRVWTFLDQLLDARLDATHGRA